MSSSLDVAEGPGFRADRRLVAVAGVLFFVWLLVAGGVYGAAMPMPTFADSVAYHRAYYSDHATAVLLHAWASGLCWVFFFLIFAAGLRRELEAGRRAPGIWPSLSFTGAVLAVAFGGVGLIFQSVATTVAASAPDDLLRVLARMMVIADATLLYWGLALFVVSASLAVLRTRRFGSWLAWLGFGSAALMVVGALWPLTGDDRGAMASLGLAGLLVLGVWVALAARALLRPSPAGSDS